VVSKCNPAGAAATKSASDVIGSRHHLHTTRARANVPLVKTKPQHYSHTISVIFVDYLMQSAERIGFDPIELLSAVKMSPELLQQPRARVSPEQFSQLVRTFWRVSGEESLGMSQPRSKFGVFTLIAKLLLQCKNLNELYERGSGLYNLLTDGFRLTFTPDYDRDTHTDLARFEIEMNDPSVDPNYTHLEFLLIIWYRFPGWMIGERIPLHRVTFAHPPPRHENELRYLFPVPCEYNSDANSIIFDARCLDKTVIASPRALRLHLARAPLDWFIREPYHPRQTSNLMRLLNQSPLNELPSIEDAATVLNTSVRTLRRSLELEGTGFRRLKENYRRDQAIQLLGDADLSVAEIGYRLGFNEAGSFIRSFKQWTGVSPGSYRKSRLG